MSAKDCAHHHRKRQLRRAAATTLTVSFLILFIVLLIHLILRPAKPQFTLQDITIDAFNFTSPNLLTTKFQVTLSTRNPNEHIGIYYEKLGVHISYHNQQITMPTSIPSTYQGHKDVAVWSPIVYGDNVPVSPYVSEAINEDRASGTVMVNVRVDGRVRWKVGSFITGKYHLNVNCPAYINCGRKNINGGNDITGNVVAVGGGMKSQLILDCHVDV